MFKLTDELQFSPIRILSNIFTFVLEWFSCLIMLIKLMFVNCIFCLL